MSERIKLHRRIVSRARWEYRQSGAELARQAEQLRQWQRRCEQIAAEIEELVDERATLLAGGQANLLRCEGAAALALELAQRLAEWERAVAAQRERVAECRRELGRTRQRERKCREKHRQVVLDAHRQRALREADEIEAMYIGRHGGRS